MSRGRQFRDLLRRGGLTIAPGAYDCITAKAAEECFEDRFTWKEGDLTFVYDPEVKFCSLDGEPALYRLGRAWLFRDPEWRSLSGMESNEVRLLSKEDFDTEFPVLPPLPKALQQFLEQVTTPPRQTKK